MYCMLTPRNPGLAKLSLYLYIFQISRSDHHFLSFANPEFLGLELGVCHPLGLAQYS